MLLNSYWRLSFFQLNEYLRRLYTLEGRWKAHPAPESLRLPEPPADFIRIVPLRERKPNPILLLDICEREGIRPAEVVYVGDSLTRDVSMAKGAGVTAVWARYGTIYNRDYWKILVQITHWTDEDVKREEVLREQFKDINPDVVINKFEEVLTLFLE
jgi:phosphoglycolate phosphatase-like HAD superfamily hydrolase